MKTINLYLISCSILIACNSSDRTKDTATTSDTAFNTADTNLTKNEHAEKVDTMSISFFKNAALGSMIEMESSTKMLQLSKNKAIKTFAGMLIKDHGNITKELKALATEKGFIIPVILPDDKLSLVKKIDSYKDEGRNEYYAELMIQQHMNAIDLFAQASRTADVKISSFAKATLPILNHHYQEITKIDSTLKAAKANQGDDPLSISNRKKQ